MRESTLRLVKCRAEFMPKARLNQLPEKLRGVYVLYKQRRGSGRPKYDVLYVGMASAGRRGGIRGRLASHEKSKRKGKLWTHFSAFQVWDNIHDEEIAELEGLFRHIYRKTPVANRLNIQRGFGKARRLPEIPLRTGVIGSKD